MRPKKTRKEVFAPKKIRIKRARRRQPAKIALGERYGKKWYPHSKGK